MKIMITYRKNALVKLISPLCFKSAKRLKKAYAQRDYTNCPSICLQSLIWCFTLDQSTEFKLIDASEEVAHIHKGNQT